MFTSTFIAKTIKIQTIRKLTELRDEGILTEEEFEEKKRQKQIRKLVPPSEFKSLKCG